MKLSEKKSKSVGRNETFVTLIRVAREDKEIGNQLVGILMQSSFHRKSLLNDMINEMRFRSAPVEFVNAIACLLDDAVAAKAKELIGK